MKTTITTAHTPGPWNSSYNVKTGKARIWGTDTGGEVHATVMGDANASLIAAAPEMLDALNESLRVVLNLRADHEGAWHQDEISAVDELVHQIRASISKAEGRS